MTMFTSKILTKACAVHYSLIPSQNVALCFNDATVTGSQKLGIPQDFIQF